MKQYEKEMSKLLEKMGVEDHEELASVLVAAAAEQQRQREMFPKEFDDQNNSYEWAGYVMKTLGSGMAGYPVNPTLFREKCVHTIALISGAVMSVDRNPQNIDQKKQP